MSKTILTSLQKGLFTAETAEYAEQYLMKAFASFAFFAVSFCSGLDFAIRRYPSVLDGLPRCLLPCSTIPVNCVQLIKALLPNYPCCSDRLFVFPSLYEGLGLPVLEAMACGTPVVCSSTSILPEVTGDAALLVDPTDGRALAGAMEQALKDDALRATLRVRGMEQARRFTWEEAAQKTLMVYRKMGRTWHEPE